MGRFTKVSVALAALLFFGTVIVLAAGQLNYRDPFVAYEAMMPGRMVSPEAPPCDLHPMQASDSYPPNANVDYCALYPTEGVFAAASAYTHNRRFVFLSLRVAGDLRVGDLVLRWGHPDTIVRNDRSFYVRWSDQQLYGLIRVRGRATQLDNWLPVDSLIINLIGDSAIIL